MTASTQRAGSTPGDGRPSPTSTDTPAPDRRVVLVHRAGAVIVAVVIAVFGVLGFAGGLAFFDTTGTPVLGLSTNGALSTISIVTAVVLVLSAWRGGRLASTVMIVIGALFLVSAFVNLWLIGTAANVLAFRLPNVFFSIGAGLVLLVLGAFGRLSGTLPDDNPYRLEDGTDPREEPADAQPRPNDVAEAEADAAMAEAERTVVAGGGSPELRRRVEAVAALRTQEERRARWLETADDARA
jgi:hypothetical protein